MNAQSQAARQGKHDPNLAIVEESKKPAPKPTESESRNMQKLFRRKFVVRSNGNSPDTPPGSK